MRRIGHRIAFHSPRLTLRLRGTAKHEAVTQQKGIVCRRLAVEQWKGGRGARGQFDNWNYLILFAVNCQLLMANCQLLYGCELANAGIPKGCGEDEVDGFLGRRGYAPDVSMTRTHEMLVDAALQLLAFLPKVLK